MSVATQYERTSGGCLYGRTVIVNNPKANGADCQRIVDWVVTLDLESQHAKVLRAFVHLVVERRHENVVE